MKNINEFFIETSYAQFSEKLNTLLGNGSLGIINEGFISVESFLYFVWIADENMLDVIALVRNHEGAWDVEVYDAVTVHYFNEIKKTFQRVHNFQFVDDISQLEFTTIHTEL